MKTKPQFRGSIILMHDGGGDRSVTVAALPLLIDTLRAKGYKIVPVSASDRQDARASDAADPERSNAGRRALMPLLSG